MHRSHSGFNSALADTRRSNLDGMYDPQTNVMQRPQIAQPTHLRWEPVHTSASKKGLTGSEGSTDPGPAATPSDESGSPPLTDAGYIAATASFSPSIFSPIALAYTRRFLVVDTYFATPPTSVLGVPGPDGNLSDISPPGLDQIDDEVLTALPPECLSGFLAAREQVLQWKNRWRGETEDGARRTPRIGH